MKLFDSELKILEALWQHGELTAGQLARILAQDTGWNRNTTYTVLKKCIDKGAVRRIDPGYRCQALVTREEVRREETHQLIRRFFAGSAEQFFTAFLDGERLSPQEVERLKELVNRLQ